MWPRNSSNNSPSRQSCNTKYFSNVACGAFTRGVFRSIFNHLILGNLGPSIFRSFCMSILCTTIKFIDRTGTKEQMGRIYAPWIVAMMTNTKPNRNCAVENHPRKSVCSPDFLRHSFANPELSVTPFGNCSSPNPAIKLLVHVRPKAIDDLLWYGYIVKRFDVLTHIGFSVSRFLQGIGLRVSTIPKINPEAI